MMSKVIRPDKLVVEFVYDALGSIAPNAPPPPKQSAKDHPITWVFDPDSFAPAAKLVGD